MVNGLEITDVAVFAVKNQQEGSKLKAFAKVTLNDQFVIGSLRIVDGKNGLFIGFPQNYNKDEDKGYDICFPVTSELREYFTSKIIEKYEAGDDEPGEESQAPEGEPQEEAPEYD